MTGNSKVVFVSRSLLDKHLVGNLPYDVTEEEVIKVFKPVGKVKGFRLVFDKTTSRPKGFGFCEFQTAEAALSAVAILDDVSCGGRSLRVRLAEADPLLEGKYTYRGEIVNQPSPRAFHASVVQSVRSNADDAEEFLLNLPAGIPLRGGYSVVGLITQTLATIPPSRLLDVLRDMKTMPARIPTPSKSFVIDHPHLARVLLVEHPQLSYALARALVLRGIVESSSLDRISLASSPTAGACHDRSGIK
ncbi:hypothetical protein CVT26_005115 [Gymnopilus dilepis]|uniref:RRM domain-containing protein n=1 Tax=Gymnopilus dilepis TaxID=231916 RepID=A0A409WBZ5_9AGAR|nr:hypothetical protein CVT26_005115 [Gymnopilus dilepis]